jgi:hypothetical protein
MINSVMEVTTYGYGFRVGMGCRAVRRRGVHQLHREELGNALPRDDRPRCHRSVRRRRWVRLHSGTSTPSVQNALPVAHRRPRSCPRDSGTTGTVARTASQRADDRRLGATVSGEAQGVLQTRPPNERRKHIHLAQGASLLSDVPPLARSRPSPPTICADRQATGPSEADGERLPVNADIIKT